MATATKRKLMTAEEFMAADLGEGVFELVRGEVQQLPPAMPEHGRLCVDACFLLETYGRRTKLGYTLANDSAVVTERKPDTVRGADVCYYSQARWPRDQVGSKLPPVPPDLVVEVVSPGNRIAAIMKKVAEYLTAGVGMVWVIFPKRGKIMIFRTVDDDAITLDKKDVIHSLPELPGFRCAVSDFFV